MSIFCGSCRHSVDIDDASQLIPCLHTICKTCVEKHSRKSQVCPIAHCYSLLVQPADQKWNSCENENCQRKLCYSGDTGRVSCLHDLCGKCFEDAYKTEQAVCPVANCNVPLDENEREKCAGPCAANLESGKLQVLPCCQVKMCAGCLEKWTEGKGTCPAEKCQPFEKKTKKGKKAISFQAKLPCQGMPECEGEVLRNFPSEQECEHSVCAGCLSNILTECEKKGVAPICPAECCRLPYRCETVLALKVLFPERAKYFNGFDLESHFSMEALKDDSIFRIYGNGTEQPSLIEINTCFCEDDENQLAVEFDPFGSLGDLLREIRRVLKIMPWDKVYGYFRRDGQAEHGAEDVPLVVRTETISKPVYLMKFTKETLLMVDITGIVNQKKRRSSVSEKKKTFKKAANNMK